MVYNTGTITADHRQRIGETIAALNKGVTRAERNNRKLLKLSVVLADLEDEHAELAGKRTLTRAEGNTIQSCIAQKERLARTIQEESGGGEQDRRILAATLHACQPLVSELLTLALNQVQAEVAQVLTPFFRAEGNRASEAARGTDLEQQLIHTFRRSSNAVGESLDGNLIFARETVALLGDIAADRDICSLQPAPVLAAA